MSTQREKSFDVRYDITTPDFVISHNEDMTFSAPWVIRDGSDMAGNQTDIQKYFHELCAIFGKQIKEFEGLRHKANKQEQKRLQNLLTLTLEAQGLLYDDEDV